MNSHNGCWTDQRSLHIIATESGRAKDFQSKFNLPAGLENAGAGAKALTDRVATRATRRVKTADKRAMVVMCGNNDERRPQKNSCVERRGNVELQGRARTASAALIGAPQ